EMLIETARFWASRAQREDDGRYHIRGVIGPDEYHVTVDDNAYTNGMAQWNLEAAAQVVESVADRGPDRWQALSRRLGVGEDEKRTWLRMARDMYPDSTRRPGFTSSSVATSSWRTSTSRPSEAGLYRSTCCSGTSASPG